MLSIKPRTDRKLMMLPPDKIVPSPFQPRKEFDYYELLELASSIKSNGLIQPLTVRKKDEFYELISGERRLRACIFAGIRAIPSIVVTASDRECSLMCLIENIQRTDLNFFEEADGIKRLMFDFSLTQTEVSEKLGMAQSTLSNKLRLLSLSSEQRGKITSSGLTERHARALLRVSENERDDLLNRIIAEQLSLSETEALVSEMLSPSTEGQRRVKSGGIGDFRIFTNSITKIIASMRKSGVDARSSKSETDSYIEYTIIIPKEKPSDCQMSLV